MSLIYNPADLTPFSVDVIPAQFSDREFAELCARNPDKRLERKTNGDVVVMAPAHARTGARNAEISRQLANWAIEAGAGMVFDSSSGFVLPDTSILSPDASWVSDARLAPLEERQLEGFPAVCPDFVIELRSRSDRLKQLQDKLSAYIDNGVRLGWLIDPEQQRVYVYRPNQPMEILERAESVSGEEVLAGFVLQLQRVWKLKY